jgi:NADH-quinone oxidoreductase subunit L
MRRMGGLRKYMPITYWTMMIAALAISGIPGFSGFFSKESIIEATHLSRIPGAGFAYFCALTTVFVTALYNFRLIFMTFHGPERFRESAVADAKGEHGHGEHALSEHDESQHAAHESPTDAHAHGEHGHGAHDPHESPWVVTVPLIALAIPSICAGWVIGTVLFGGYFGKSIFVAPAHDVLAHMAEEFHGVTAMMAHAVTTPPFILAIAGIATAVFLYLIRPDLPAVIKRRAGVLFTILDRKYYLDELYSFLFARGARLLGTGLWKAGDVGIIDGLFVNGSARFVGWSATIIRRWQTGYIYNYAFTMIFGVLVLLTLIFVWQ